ncbi:hypothetical protein ACN4EG_21250 [Alkalinema pantanalense CENA528]|uniref:hypothetical protein n=1 Tax=Alkalinema pantanalense TaxID=1620705 RepID=UPI003D6FDA0C
MTQTQQQLEMAMHSQSTIRTIAQAARLSNGAVLRQLKARGKFSQVTVKVNT